jgi:hypothetical protein
LLSAAQAEIDDLRDRVAELEGIQRRAEEMAAHEPGFGGTVARYILGEVQ